MDYVAGIISNPSSESNINNCYNCGSVTGTKDYIGGIVGYIGAGNIVVSNCYNKANITAKGEGSGGIIGYVSTGQPIIESCYNIGDIIGTEETGGISGSVIGNTSINYNAGNVKGTTKVGGITGQNWQGPGKSYFKNFNIGKVIGSSYTASICGYGYRSTNVITDCYYEIGTADYGIGYPQSNSGCTFGTRDEIIQQIETLDEFKTDEYNINNGNPILSWQTDNDKLNLINSDNAFVEDLRRNKWRLPNTCMAS